VRKKERRTRRRERREQRDEEYRLREQQGLSPLVTSEYSSLGEEEESDGGHALLRGGILHPLTESRRGGRGASARGGRGSARRQAVCGRGGAHRGSASAEASGSAAVETAAATTAPVKPSRKRKWGFSTLR
jgi:hypothetical protein